MIYDWFLITNLTAFLATDLPSLEITVELEGLGQKDILITRGNAISILYDGVFLTANFNAKNPFEFESHAVYLDEAENIYLGILNES